MTQSVQLSADVLRPGQTPIEPDSEVYQVYSVFFTGLGEPACYH